MKIDLKNENFAMFESFCVVTMRWWSSHKNVFSSPIRE